MAATIRAQGYRGQENTLQSTLAPALRNKYRVDVVHRVYVIKAEGRPYMPRLTCLDFRALDNEIQTDVRRYVDRRYSCRATRTLNAKLRMTAVIHVSQRPTIKSYELGLYGK